MSKAQILPHPPLPEGIRCADLSNGELVLFVGAGASMLKGLPSWQGWAEAVLNALYKEGKLNFFEFEQLKKLDPRKQLSIAKILKQDVDLIKHLEAKKSDKEESQIYEYLNDLGCIYVTTNYDRLLNPMKKIGKDDNSKSPDKGEVIHNIDDYEENKLIELLDKSCTVIHLHGSQDYPNSMKVTTKEYLEHYGNPKLTNFLTALFANKVVLFIGYSLEEVEILENIMRRGKIQEKSQSIVEKSNNRRRFMLQGFFRSEQSLFDKLYEYYSESFEVELIGFSRDEKDYDQLEYIIKAWVGELLPMPISLLEELDNMRKVLNDT